MTLKPSAWTGMLPVDDTALCVGDSLGTKGGEMDQGRTVLDPILARNPNLRAAKVASNHTDILRKDFRAVADAVRDLAANPCRQAA
jgi:hypothetical protein